MRGNRKHRQREKKKRQSTVCVWQRSHLSDLAGLSAQVTPNRSRGNGQVVCHTIKNPQTHRLDIPSGFRSLRLSKLFRSVWVIVGFIVYAGLFKKTESRLSLQSLQSPSLFFTLIVSAVTWTTCFHNAIHPDSHTEHRKTACIKDVIRQGWTDS